MARLFGTDGVRGLANRDVTAQLALQIGEAAARGIAGEDSQGATKPIAVVGRDTRISGEFLDHAISAGLAAAGMDVVRVGVVTTPTVAHLAAADDQVALGVMISASHNPMPDNGIKLFAHGGYKLDDAVEDHVESLIGQEWERPTGGDVGDIMWDPEPAERSYINHLVESVGADLTGLRIAVDCANGAASRIGPAALRAAGAEVVVINAEPDGHNINDRAGSNHPETLQAFTVESGADFGVAYDGDADRCIAVDAAGNVVDGDKVMGALALDLKSRGELAHDTLVVTVMSNLGLLLAMEEAGIRTVQTAVGDRYVLEAMREGDFTLGGEQSGHIIASAYATTGDGILSSILIGRMLKTTGQTLAQLVEPITRLPQTLVNVPGVDRAGVSNPQLQEAVEAAEETLGNTGRVVLRASGTEPLVRVMVEAATQQESDRVAASLAQSVKEFISL